MPIYSYQCDNCHYKFDVFQHYDDDKLVVCPQCSKPKLRKLFTPVGIVFKGSGFYATDHRSPSGMMPSPHEHDADKPLKTGEPTTSQVAKGEDAAKASKSEPQKTESGEKTSESKNK